MVLDARDAKPVAATVSAGSSSTTTAQDGRFILPEPGSQEPLRVVASGYRARELRFEAAPRPTDLGTVELVPLNCVCITVLDDGTRPVAGAEIVGTRRVQDETLPRPIKLGTTRGDGRAVVELDNVTGFYAVRGTSASVWQDLQTQVDADLSVALRPSVKLGVRTSGSREIRPSTPLRLDGMGDSGSWALVLDTAADGATPVPAPHGTFAVSTPRGTLARSPESAQDHPRPSHSDRPLALIVDARDSGGLTVWFEVAHSGARRIILRSAANNSPVQRARFGLERWWEGFPPTHSARWLAVTPPVESYAEDGGHALDALDLGTDWGETGIRLVVDANGYRTQQVDDVIRALPAGTELRLELEPAPVGSVRVFASDGLPYTRPFWIRDSERNTPIALHADSSGLVEGYSPQSSAFELCGSTRPGDVLVRVDVPQSAVLDALVVHVPTGTIEARVGGLDPKLVTCIRRGDVEIDPSVSDSGSIVWNQVPTGAYVVGPREVVRLAAVNDARGGDSHPTEVLDGQTTVIDLTGTSKAPSVIEGYVRCVGIEPSLVQVAPFFGSGSDPIPGNMAGTRFPVREDGSFTLSGLATMPTRLVFGTRDTNSEFQPLALGSLGAENVVACGRISVAIPPAGCERALTVLYSLDQVEKHVLGMRAVDGPCTAPLIVHHVPVTVRRIQVFSSVGRRALDVEIQAGRTTEVRLD